MKKRIFSLLLLCLMAAALLLPAGALAAESSMIRDEAGLLSLEDQNQLEAQAQNLASQYQCGVYVLTVDSLQGMDRRSFAEHYYLTNDLGVGSRQSGILFLVAMETREYVTITYGDGITVFTDYGIERLEDQVVEELSEGDYDDAFEEYLEVCQRYFQVYQKTGQPYDYNHSGSILVPLLITILVPLVIALVVCMIFLSQMKTARAATQANDYIPKGGFHLTRQVDQYTHSTQTRRRIEKPSNSGGGGSSVSSSGFGGSKGGHF